MYGEAPTVASPLAPRSAAAVGRARGAPKRCVGPSSPLDDARRHTGVAAQKLKQCLRLRLHRGGAPAAGRCKSGLPAAECRRAGAAARRDWPAAAVRAALSTRTIVERCTRTKRRGSSCRAKLCSDSRSRYTCSPTCSRAITPQRASGSSSITATRIMWPGLSRYVAVDTARRGTGGRPARLHASHARLDDRGLLARKLHLGCLWLLLSNLVKRRISAHRLPSHRARCEQREESRRAVRAGEESPPPRSKANSATLSR